MRPLLCAHLATTAFALPLFFRRSPPPALSIPRSIPYNVVSVDGHDASPDNKLKNRNPEPIPASYSVVPVDGGPSAFTGAAAPPTRTETLLTTHLATITVTDAEQPTTIVITVTEPHQTQAPQAPPQAATEETTVTETVSAAPSGGAVQTVPYDNGMWHGTYYYTTAVSTSTPTPASTSSSQTAAPTQTPWHDSPFAAAFTSAGAADDDSDDSSAAAATSVSGQSAPSAASGFRGGDADVDAGLSGVQLIGTPVATEMSSAQREAWLEGKWAPWEKGPANGGGERR